MNKLLIILIILVIVLYVRFNLKYSPNYEILQIYPSQITPELLNEKNPIVIETIEDKNVGDLITSALKYLYLYKLEYMYQPKELPVKNNAKYVFITTKSQNSDIEIINPKYKQSDNYKSVSVKLNPKQVLILPSYWRFKCDNNLNCVSVHDLFSSFYQTFATIL